MKNKNSIFIKILALFLCTVLTLPALISCAGKGGADATAEGTALQQEEPALDPEIAVITASSSTALFESAPGLFWNNQLYKEGPFVGDPYILYDDGVFYLYGTTRKYVKPGSLIEAFEVYTSTDLVTWKDAGQAFKPAKTDWSRDRLWAPEVYKVGDKYYMYYTAAGASSEPLHGSVAVADSPLGPFSNKISDEVNGRKPVFDFGKDFPTIDGTFFTDDDGKMYYFFVRDQIGDSAAVGKDKTVRSTLWGIELENPYTIKEGASPVKLTEVGRSTVDETGKYTQNWERSRGLWNEGPFVLKHDGKYYLTYSANAFTSEFYAIGYAVSDTPLGRYVKGGDAEIMGIDPDEDKSRAYFAGTGHAMFLDIGGDMYVVYHTLIPNTDTWRHFTIDRAGFREDGSLYINGPTLSAQPLPDNLNGLKNIAESASRVVVTGAGGESVGESGGGESDPGLGLLTDGEFCALSATAGRALTLPAGRSTLTFEFDRLQDVRGVLVYNSADYEKSFVRVANVSIGSHYSANDVPVLSDSVDSSAKLVKAGSFAPVVLSKAAKVFTVTVTFDCDRPTAVSEIVILAET